MRSSRVSRAFHTAPIPPAPIADSTSYGPSLVPGARIMVVVQISLAENLLRGREPPQFVEPIDYHHHLPRPLRLRPRQSRNQEPAVSCDIEASPAWQLEQSRW